MSSSAIADLAAQQLVKRIGSDVRNAVHWLPVLHVEQLDNATFAARTIEFAKKYKEITGCRIMATVMTPFSPLVANRLKAENYDPERYAATIIELAEHAEIGLHGHYVRENMWPQHLAYFDLDHIKEQIVTELAFLAENGLDKQTPLSYSAGWWFMTPPLANVLVDCGFALDFSLSLSKENFSISSNLALREFDPGEILTCGNTDSSLKGAFALASTNRSKSQFAGLLKNGALRWKQAKPRYFTLYSHDYDLIPEQSIAAVVKLADAGFSFFEARQLLD